MAELDKLAMGTCPVCGSTGYEPCRVLSHRDERERKDHKTRPLRDHPEKNDG